MVENRRLDLGFVAGLSVESFGEPGQRTFRVLAQTGQGSVSVWLEKEQVVMLGTAVEEVLERVPAPRGTEPRASTPAAFVGDLEVKAADLSLGYDAAADGFRIEANEFVAALPIDTIDIVASRSQLDELRGQIDSIVSASRPRCVLCGTPLTGGPHFCPESNGHADLEVGH